LVVHNLRATTRWCSCKVFDMSVILHCYFDKTISWVSSSGSCETVNRVVMVGAGELTIGGVTSSPSEMTLSRTLAPLIDFWQLRPMWYQEQQQFGAGQDYFFFFFFFLILKS
jgi:hypothetical protein